MPDLARLRTDLCPSQREVAFLPHNPGAGAGVLAPLPFIPHRKRPRRQQALERTIYEYLTNSRFSLIASPCCIRVPVPDCSQLLRYIRQHRYLDKAIEVSAGVELYGWTLILMSFPAFNQQLPALTRSTMGPSGDRNPAEGQQQPIPIHPHDALHLHQHHHRESSQTPPTASGQRSYQSASQKAGAHQPATHPYKLPPLWSAGSTPPASIVPDSQSSLQGAMAMKAVSQSHSAGTASMTAQSKVGGDRSVKDDICLL